jgi:hypothetical protein
MRSKLLFLVAILLFFTSSVWAADSLSSVSNPTGVATFESIGVYVDYDGDDDGDATCSLEYRVQGAGSWSDGQDLWNDTAEDEFRGSLVHLQSGSTYDVRITVNDPDGNPGQTVYTSVVDTWSEIFPVGVVTNVTDSGHLTISTSGTSGAYRVYQPAGGSGTITGVTVDANYVVVRNFTISNPAGGGSNGHGVHVYGGRHDVVIEHNEITAWGRSGVGVVCNPAGWCDKDEPVPVYCVKNFNWQDNSGVFVGPDAYRVIIQNNEIHDPNGRSALWWEYTFSCHTAGPQGISFSETLGNHVVRYNDIHSRDTYDPGTGYANWYNDVIGGQYNRCVGCADDDAEFNGSLYGDTDIYGNILQDAGDDALEIEGRNRNVRVWNNVLARSNRGLSTCESRWGPLYAWKNFFGPYDWENLSDRSNLSGHESMKDCYSSNANLSHTAGPRYYYHNTYRYYEDDKSTQWGWSSFQYSTPHYATYKNNIIESKNQQPGSPFTTDSTNFMDFNMFNIWPRFPSPNPDNWHVGNVIEVPNWDSPVGIYSYFPAAGDGAVDSGVVIPNFNDDYIGSLPDMGYLERGGSSILVGPQPRPAQIFYVRPAGGSYGLEDGSSYDNAWDGFTDIDWEIIAPGSTLFVVGTHREQLNVDVSGTSGNPINIVSCTTLNNCNP